jgi:virginiamycin B lyase
MSRLALARGAIIALMATGCSALPAGNAVPAASSRADAHLPPSGIPGLVEVPHLATIPNQIASDLAGNEWIAGFGPSMLVKLNEQSRTYTQYALPDQNSEPYAVALDANHTSMWFTELSSNTIGYIRLSTGAIHRYSIPTNSAKPYGIVGGPDNAMWFTEMGTGKIGRIDLSSFNIAEYALPSGHQPFQITLGQDGALWFTDYAGYGIGRMTTSHHFSNFSFNSTYFLEGITTASDGGIWFVGSSSTFPELVGRIDPFTHAKKIFLYAKGAAARVPRMVVSRDSELWFTEQQDAVIARFNVSTHKLNRYKLPAGYSLPIGIAVGSDTQLWFTEQDKSPHDPATGKLCPYLTHDQCASSGSSGRSWTPAALRYEPQ